MGLAGQTNTQQLRLPVSALGAAFTKTVIVKNNFYETMSILNTEMKVHKDLLGTTGTIPIYFSVLQCFLWYCLFQTVNIWT